MTRNQPKSDAFDRVAADPGKEWDATFDVMISWEKASVQAKVGFLAACAAIYDAPFERFAKVVEESIGRPGPVAGEQWTLRGQYEGARMLLGPRDAATNSYEGKLNQRAELAAQASEKGKDNSIER